MRLPESGRERKTLRGEAARALFAKAKPRMGGFASRFDREPITSASAGSGRANDTAALLRYSYGQLDAHATFLHAVWGAALARKHRRECPPIRVDRIAMAGKNLTLWRMKPGG